MSSTDVRVTLLKGLPVVSRPGSSSTGRPSTGVVDHEYAGALLPPARLRGIAPPMPEGEEYDSETEAERQAAWEEYYRVTQMSGAVAVSDIAQDHTSAKYQYQSGHTSDGYVDE